MIQAVDLHRDLAGLPLLKERYGHPTDAESLQSFATLAAYRDGGIFATHFNAWCELTTDGYTEGAPSR